MLDYNPYPGLRVTCVVDALLEDILRRHDIYTVVRAVEGWGRSPFDGESFSFGPCLVLAEVTNPFNDTRGFDARRFRPLDEIRLGVFRAMLTTAPRELVEG